MRARLIRAPRPRFSKTARSGPGLGEAGRDGPEISRSPAIGRRRLADHVGKRSAERPQAREADVEADLGHAAVALAEQEHRSLDPAALQVAMRCLAESGTEGADEV